MNKIIAILDETIKIVDIQSPNVAKSLRADAYVQLLNLAYVCDARNSVGAMKKWRDIRQEKGVDDDKPNSVESIRFVLFGWGKKFNPKDGERVSQLLASLGVNGVPFLFPAKDPKSGKQALRTPVRCGKTAKAIRKQIESNTCDYPSRVTYAPEVAKTLARLLRS